MGGINYELTITNYGRSEGQEELGIWNWGWGVASWEWVNGECSWGSLAKRTKSERGKKGIWDWVSSEGEGF